jgi:hypothetical protein
MFKNKMLVSVATVLIVLGGGALGYSLLGTTDAKPSPQTTYRGVTFTYPADWQVTNKQLRTDATHTVPSIGIHTKDSNYYVLATLKSTGQVAQTSTRSEALLVSATRLKGLKDTFDLRWIVHEFGADTSVYSSAEFLMSAAQYSRLGWSNTKATPTVPGDAPAFKLPNGTELTVGTNSKNVYRTAKEAKAWFFTPSGYQAHAILLSATVKPSK